MKLRVSSLLGLMTALACAPACDRPSTSGGSRGPRSRADVFEGITVVPVDVTFGGPAAPRYGEPVPHRTSPTEAAIGKELERLGMTPDPALHRAARELARSAPDRANLPSGLIDAVMAWAGLVDPPPRLVVVELPSDPAGCHSTYTAACQGAVASLIGKVETPDSRIPPHYGAGVARAAGGRTRMIIAVVEPMVALEPIPTSIAMGRSVKVQGRLVGARQHPSVELVDATGAWTRVSTSVSLDGTFSAQVACGPRRGRHQVEVLADGAHGPEVAANFPLYCGARAPSRARVELERLESSVDAVQIARANFEYLNAERKRRGLDPLSWDDRAADVASDHSRDMLRGGFVGHVSPRTGDASNRFERAKIVGAVIRENVARGYGPKGIHDSLMSSPGHRVNMLADDVTHVGIGVVVGPVDPDVPQAPRPVFCTQNFFKKPGAGAPRDTLLAPTMRKRVDAARREQRLGKVRWDDGLDAVAAAVAKRVAAGRRLQSGWEQEVFDLGYETVETNQVRSADFDALAGLELWNTSQLAAGIGIVRVPEAKGGGFLMIVLVTTR